MSTESYVLLRREKHARPQLKFELEVCGLDIDVKKKSEKERERRWNQRTSPLSVTLIM